MQGWGAAVAFAVLSSSSAGHADAQQAPAVDPAREEARQHFDVGVALMENENWEAALLEFAGSFDLYPTRSALFNLGMCLKALHRYREALDAFRRWEERFAPAAGDAERRGIAAAIDEMTAFLGDLRLVVDPPGAAVTVDGEPIGIAPFLLPIPIDVGHHRIEVALDGYETAIEEVVVLSRNATELAVTLSPRVPVVPAPLPIDAPPPPAEDPGPAIGAAESPVEGPGDGPSVPFPNEPVDEGGIETEWWFWTVIGAVVAGAAVTAGVMLAPEDGRAAADIEFWLR